MLPKRRLRTILMVAVCLFVAASTYGVAAEKTVVTVWTRGAISNDVAKLADQFNATNDRIRVDVMGHGGQWATIEKFAVAVSAGVIPDIMVEMFAVPGGFVNGLSGFDDAFLDLNSYVQQSTQVEFLPGTLEMLRHQDGRQLGIPLGLESHMLMWNGRLLSEAGLNPDVATVAETWDELAAIARRLTVASGDQVSRWGFAGHIGPMAMEMYWSAPGAPEVYDYDKRQTNVRPGDTVGSWIGEYWWDAFHGAKFANWNRDLATASDVPIFYDSATHTLNWMMKLGLTDPFGLDPILASVAPRHNDGQHIQLLFVNQWQILKDSPVIDAAWEFLEWASTPSNQGDFIEHNRGQWVIGVAPGPNAYSSALMQEYPIVASVLRALSEVPSRPPGWAIGYSPAHEVLTKLWQDPKKSVTQALEEVSVQADAYLQRVLP